LNTSAHYQRQLKRTTFFLDRAFGGKLILEKLRGAGLTVESHHVRFRHNTPDAVWLQAVGEKKWIVLTRDAMIGRRHLELDALLSARARVFVVVAKEYTDEASGNIIIAALPKILKMLDESRFPFIARITDSGTVNLWKTEPMRRKGIKVKKRR
jgi:hypothetical protein